MPSLQSSVVDPIDKVVRRMENDDLIINSQIWTKAEEGILKDSLQPYRDTASGEKGNFIKYKVVKRIKALEQKKHPEGALKEGGTMAKMWRMKKKRIYRYMMNHGSTPRGIKLPGLNRKFTYDSVVREFRRADILLEAKRLASLKEDQPVSVKKWIGYYQQARKYISDNLEEPEKEVIRETVIKWNKGYVPPEIQQRMAKRQSKKVLKEMNRRLFLGMGIRSLTMECHLAEDGTMRYSLTDTEGLKLDDPRIPAFRTFDPDAVKNMESAYKRYVKYIYDVLKDPETPIPPAEVIPEVNLEYYLGGLPKVPDLVVNCRGRESNKVQQEMIRKYISKHHELALGRQARFFYQPIADDLSTCLAPGSWPEGVPFKETSRYDVGESTAIITHWRTRQEEGQIPFKFEWLHIGNSSVPAKYPKDIFKLAQEAGMGLAEDAAAAAEPPPQKTQAPKAKQAKRSTLRDWDETDTDSEAQKSEQEELGQETGSDSVRASTPPNSQVDTESVAGYTTRGTSEAMSSSPLKKVLNPVAVKRRGQTKKGGRTLGITKTGGQGAVNEEAGMETALSSDTVPPAAVPRKSNRLTRAPPPPPRSIRATRTRAAAMAEAPSKKVKKTRK